MKSCWCHRSPAESNSALPLRIPSLTRSIPTHGWLGTEEHLNQNTSLSSEAVALRLSSQVVVTIMKSTKHFCTRERTVVFLM
jgi:hypothetical protein